MSRLSEVEGVYLDHRNLGRVGEIIDERVLLEHEYKTCTASRGQEIVRKMHALDKEWDALDRQWPNTHGRESALSVPVVSILVAAAITAFMYYLK